MVQQRINEGAVGIARSGMDDKPVLLVDDDDILVFVENGQGNIFGEQFGGSGGGKGNLDLIARCDDEARLYRTPVYLDHTVFDEILQGRARDFEPIALQCAKKELIKTHAVISGEEAGRVDSGFGLYRHDLTDHKPENKETPARNQCVKIIPCLDQEAPDVASKKPARGRFSPEYDRAALSEV